MKKITMLVLLLAVFTSVKAQTADAPGQSGNGSFIGLLGGISMPMGNFKKVNYYDTTSGYAGNGSTFGLEGAWFFSKYVGFGGMMSVSTFNVSTQGLDSLSRGYQLDFFSDRTSTSINSAYKIWTIMPGIYLRYPLSDKLSINGKVLAGLSIATTPSIVCDVWDGGVDDGDFRQLPCTVTSLGVVGGLGVSYNLCKNFAINLQGNYFYSKPDFFLENSNRQVKAGRLINEYNQPLTFMNFSLGVAYTFGKK
jgi:opacity protein-like surface antigen